MQKKIKFNICNFIVLITMIISSVLLIHDFVFWGIIPAFTGVFYELTYFGLFLDIVAIGLLELSIQLIKEW